MSKFKKKAKRHVNKKWSGYTLLELAVVLVIAAVLVTTMLTAVNTQIQSAYISTTNNNLQTISDALEKYFANTGHLPCPADLNTATTDTNYGLARVNSSSGQPDTCVTSANSLFSLTDNNEVVYMGAVPFKTIGLPNAFMFDGWDNKITYVVQKSFINGSVTSTCIAAASAADLHTNSQYICPRGQASGSVTSNAGDIVIYDYLSGRILNSDAVYVLISHGKNGLGAFLKTADGSGPNTDRNPLPPYPANVNERNNTNCDTASSSCSSTALQHSSFSTIGGTAELATFDDIILYRTRNQVIYDCNYYHNNACTSGGSTNPNRDGTDLR